ncbi:MAG: PD-(D/E)XK nuclease family protein, partial [Undibacterium sp.]|nr:PD-(D/E)XK nuclease family protein [Undibacterium sp.]
LYGELRQHAWLKKLFGAKRNTDLLPLAQTLLTLSDELSSVWLPTALAAPKQVESSWHHALAQLPLPVQKMVSEETQLVWTLWQGQLEGKDRIVQEFKQMHKIAEQAMSPLVWIAPTPPNALEQAFLDQYQLRQEVLVMSIDWRENVLPSPLSQAWPELAMKDDLDKAAQQNSVPLNFNRLRLCPASSLEEEAEQGAQTIVNWLVEGKQSIAVIAQDRVVSRRLRALLERAEVHVLDETGWKLSTTRAAAVLAAWFEVVSSRADTIALLDFLKSPFLPLQDEKKPEALMEIERALLRANVLGGWDAVLSVLESLPEIRQSIVKIARLANSYQGAVDRSRRTIKEWTASSLQVLSELGIEAALQQDQAGVQVLQMLHSLSLDCQFVAGNFSFSEWRAFMNMQMENTPFTTTHQDKRVLMLPLNGARLRSFDAVLVIGADAKHLPSKAQETLFFSNAVRRECGLITREQRQQQQLRDFAEVVLANTIVVLSWQSELNGEYNASSPWIEQLSLALARQKQAPLASGALPLTLQNLVAQDNFQPQPSAAILMPETLSSSGLSSLIACPYQFFAGRMLKLSAMDELSDRPEKRDYGDWLHAILKTYHDQVKAENLPLGEQRLALLTKISDTLFQRILKHTPAALGYSVRWAQVMPAYLEWANAREAQGWQFEIGEAWAETQLSWSDGAITLRGRIDRLDKRDQDGGVEYEVLDYKTKKQRELKNRLKTFEDHQLPFYGLLAQSQAEQASYVALELEKEKLGDARADNFDEWKNQLEQSIKQTLQAIQHDAALPANGIESVCQYCDMRGLCRKGAW